MIQKSIMTGMCLFAMLISNGGSVTNSRATTSTIEQVMVSIRAHDKPIEKVLKDIEKQTDYKITISKELSKSITIQLENYPLEKGLNRLMSGLNYSIVCDEQGKTLDIIVVSDKKNVSPTAGLSGEMGKTNESKNNMSGSDLAFERYKKLKASGGLPIYDSSKLSEGPMAGSDVAMDRYRELKKNNKLPVYDRSSNSKGPMSGSDLALVKYKEMKARGELPVTNEFVVGKGPMKGSDEAMARHLATKKSSFALKN